MCFRVQLQHTDRRRELLAEEAHCDVSKRGVCIAVTVCLLSLMGAVALDSGDVGRLKSSWLGLGIAAVRPRWDTTTAIDVNTLQSRLAIEKAHIESRRVAGKESRKMANSLEGCVSSLRSSMQLLDSSITILDSGVNDFPRLAKVLQTTRVCGSLYLLCD